MAAASAHNPSYRASSPTQRKRPVRSKRPTGPLQRLTLCQLPTHKASPIDPKANVLVNLSLSPLKLF